MEAMGDVQVSSASCSPRRARFNGEQEVQPVREDLPPTLGSPYAVSKLAKSTMSAPSARMWGHRRPMILRVFNAYGPRQPLPPSHAPFIPSCLKQALWGGGSLVVFAMAGRARFCLRGRRVTDCRGGAGCGPASITLARSGRELQCARGQDRARHSRKVIPLHSGGPERRRFAAVRRYSQGAAIAHTLRPR